MNVLFAKTSSRFCSRNYYTDEPSNRQQFPSPSIPRNISKLSGINRGQTKTPY